MLELSEQEKNIGTVNVSSPFRFSVGLRNTGNDKVTITRIQPHCGSCTSALVESNEIPAGNVSTLKIVFTPTSTAFATTKGVDIYYQTSKLTTEKLTFRFSAKVI